MVSFGFVDCISNDYDSFDAAQNVISKYVGHSVSRLKVPVCVKKMLAKSDAVIVFINATMDEYDALHLIVEKIIDLEVDSGKYVFYCIVDRSEYKTKETFDEVASKRLEALIDFALKAIDSPKEVSSQVGTGFDFTALSGSTDLFNTESNATPPTENLSDNPFGGVVPQVTLRMLNFLAV